MDCPFDDPPMDRVFYEDELVLGLWDAYPVTKGHALVVTRRHVATWFDATAEEQAAVLHGIEIARREIEKSMTPDGYNVGLNAGEAAGQTVFHLHVHVIPRFRGDVEDPRGGVRWVIPAKADYWEPGKWNPPIILPRSVLRTFESKYQQLSTILMGLTICMSSFQPMSMSSFFLNLGAPRTDSRWS